MIPDGLTYYLIFVSSCVFIFKQIINLIGQKKLKNGDATTRLSPPKSPIGVLDMLIGALNPKSNFVKMAADVGQKGPLHMIKFEWPKLRVLVIHDFELGKKLFQTATFSARPENEFWRYHAKGNYGIVTSSGKVWDEQRRFTLRKLKDAGMGNTSMEALIEIEVEDFLKALEKVKGQVISPLKMTSVPFFNTLWVLLTGERFNHGENPLSGMLLGIYEGFLRCLEIPQVFLLGFHKSPMKIETMTKIRSWLPFKTRMDIIEAGFDNLRQFSTDLVTKRKANLYNSDNPQSFVDDYLKEVDSTTNESSSFYKEEGVMNLIATIADLYIASGETAGHTLAWAILHLIRNPQVQFKIQQELDLIDPSRRPTLADKPQCPYTEAFLWEVLRVTPASIFSMPHVTTDDVEIGPYFVEQHTTVLLNIAAIHYDPNIWEEPYEFKPERFLSTDGSTFIAHEAMIAFSLGKRKCPAAKLALNNLFLFVSAMCQKYNFNKDPHLNRVPSLTSELSGLNAPKDFNMLVEPRQI